MKLVLQNVLVFFLFPVSNYWVKCYESPIIGIVTEELTTSLHQAYPNYTSYIAASYVKAVEGAGARVVPILIGQDENYYRNVLSNINGVVFPGGACRFDVQGGYASAGELIYKLAIQINKNGTHFPILGVCLGFELLMHLANGGNELRANCESNNIGLPLVFKPGFKRSQLYKDASRDILTILSSEPVTSNHHSYCVTPTNFTKFNLQKSWRLLSVNTDSQNLVFISSVESLTFPFAGVQFHPEKNAYEWGSRQNNPHSQNAIRSARHFYDWLIKKAKNNTNRFFNDQDMFNALIDNYNIFYTAKMGLYFEQVYLFE